VARKAELAVRGSPDPALRSAITFAGRDTPARPQNYGLPVRAPPARHTQQIERGASLVTEQLPDLSARDTQGKVGHFRQLDPTQVVAWCRLM